MRRTRKSDAMKLYHWISNEYEGRFKGRSALKYWSLLDYCDDR